MFFVRMINRLVFLMFVILTGGLGAILKWVIMGTRGGRERRKTNRLLRER